MRGVRSNSSAKAPRAVNAEAPRANAPRNPRRLERATIVSIGWTPLIGNGRNAVGSRGGASAPGGGGPDVIDGHADGDAQQRDRRDDRPLVEDGRGKQAGPGEVDGRHDRIAGRPKRTREIGLTPAE